MKNASGGCRNLKLRARKRFSPFQKIRNVIEPLSGGIRGQTFCSTLQLSRSFKMLSASYKGGFFGNYFRMGKMVASIAQAPLVPARLKQGGNVRVAASYSDTFILHSGNASTNVALVARPCAPAAQCADDSSSSRSRLAKSYGRFAR